MRLSRIIALCIPLFLIGGLFFYDAPLDESNIKKPISINVSDDKVDINVADVFTVNTDDESNQADVSFGKVVNINQSDTSGSMSINLAGNEHENQTLPKGKDNTEVSISKDNPMLVRAGVEYQDENVIKIDGVGIGEIYELNGQDVSISGVKNQIVIKGKCGKLEVNGVAMSVRVEQAESILVNGLGNRLYVKNKEEKKKVEKNGLMNLVMLNKK